MSSNAGFVARELDRRRFQEAVAITLDKHAEAINDLRDQVRVTREFMADLSVRLDWFKQQLAMLEGAEVAK